MTPDHGRLNCDLHVAVPMTLYVYVAVCALWMCIGETNKETISSVNVQSSAWVLGSNLCLALAPASKRLQWCVNRHDIAKRTVHLEWSECKYETDLKNFEIECAK